MQVDRAGKNWPGHPMGQSVIYYSLLSLTCGFALWRGGGPERVAALLFVAASIASDNAYAIGSDKYLNVELGVLVVDIGAAQRLLEIVRGKEAAHRRERELIAIHKPVLNSDRRGCGF